MNTRNMENSAFITHSELNELAVPLGQCNAPATFQKLIIRYWQSLRHFVVCTLMTFLPTQRQWTNMLGI